ncbi:MAG: hypothetical protein MUP16_12120, partial [Sedimentisphaerales bacterium]|nr:hypothetical protein [Sedimentisphaerales bacterium]
MSKEKKKSRIIRRIFKWLGLTLLAILLILSLVFQAPWKIITLLAIILLACTILPKRIRKWFWLSVGAIVVILIIWVFLSDEDGDWRPYTFDEELTALQAKYAIPDEENAAVIYNQLLKDYDRDTFYIDLPNKVSLEIPMREPWSSKDHPELAQWLEDYQSTIAILMEASQIKECRFPITSHADFENQMKKNMAMRHWAFLLLTAANNDLAEGRVEESLRENIAILQMGKHQYQQLGMNEILIGIAIEALILQQLDRFIVTGDATEERLSLIEKA